jgi:hypothetical protein
MSMQQ